MKTEVQIIKLIKRLEKENKYVDERLQNGQHIFESERRDYTARLIRINQLNWVIG